MIERTIVLVLLNAMWQPLLIAACAYIVLSFARNASAATRCAVLTAALFAALLLPLASSIPALRAQQRAVSTSPTREHILLVRPVAHSRLAAAMWTRGAVATTGRVSAPDKPAARLWTAPHVALTLPRRALIAITALWGILAFVLIVRLAISFVYLERLKGDALPIATECRSSLRRWNEKAGGTLRLCVSDQAIVPIAVGWFDAMVLVPRHLVEELEPADLDRIILHEIAHLRRRDSIAHAAQKIGSALFFFSPGLSWIGRQLDLEREVACDDWVVEQRSEATPYANCLLRLVQQTPWPHSALPAPGAFVTRKSMSIRIERMLFRARNACLRPAPGPVAATLATIAAAAVLGFVFTPSVAYAVDAHPSWKTPLIEQSSAPFKHSTTRKTTHSGVPHHAHPAAPPTPPEVKRKIFVAFAQFTPDPKATIAAAKTEQPAPAATSAVAYEVMARPSSVPVARATSTPAPRTSAAPASAAGDSDGDYITQMETLFGRRLTVEQLVGLKSLNVTPSYVQQMRQAGFPDLKVDQFVAARSVGLTPQRVTELRATFGPLTFDDAVTVLAMHVDANYRATMQASGLQNLSLQQLVELKAVGITPDYIRQANTFGFGTLTARRLVELKSLGIDQDYIQRVRAHGFQNLTIEQIVELKSSGVIKK